MSQNDPTDNALAAIASILDQPPVIPRERERPAVEEVAATPPPLEPPPLEEFQPIEALPSLAVPPPLETAAPIEAAPPPEVFLPFEADGYSKVGPGPMAAIRFKWTVREDDGDYYVDETIGENSTPIVSGPMNKDAAIQLVDDREADARRRFDQLKSEMTGRAAVANLVRKDSGEA
ncbi:MULTISPECIES: hypothetical protein [unclassified Bradyrhizobium]|uniref:hypothetical protein n=1 Tax=unclassified Bradyrhizobium TaxID=2631580 RepID=UPI001BA5D1A9|nr:MULTISPECIES: hypothetical protein [unclassified Bradyrhizobium]MBR1227911.1 hypothetical protein [Bradyrhizobium sp. AUGA SZCCT0176]MBR1300800.1 hypothetical protein [Bradyrhizobium sp. AUGA SZCCT0042]